MAAYRMYGQRVPTRVIEPASPTDQEFAQPPPQIPPSTSIRYLGAYRRPKVCGRPDNVEDVFSVIDLPAQARICDIRRRS